jgi:prefoldin subunit 5
MRQYGVYEFDNRDSAEVYQYMEARIEALKRRIEELETENEVLRSAELHAALFSVSCGGTRS